MSGLLGIEPTRYIGDKHPGYFSVKKLSKEPAGRVEKCQHHYAHIASVMAEHNLRGPVLGVAYDGTGYGDDGSIWSGEILLCDKGAYERKGNLSPERNMPGQIRVWPALPRQGKKTQPGA